MRLPNTFHTFRVFKMGLQNLTFDWTVVDLEDLSTTPLLSYEPKGDKFSPHRSSFLKRARKRRFHSVPPLPSFIRSRKSKFLPRRPRTSGSATAKSVYIKFLTCLSWKVINYDQYCNDSIKRQGANLLSVVQGWALVRDGALYFGNVNIGMWYCT